MITFKTKRHIEIDESYQGINLTEFAIEVDEQIDTDKIVDTFIRSKQFSFDSLRDCIKFGPDKGYLKRAFNFDKVSITDFKKTDKNGASKFLEDFINETDWGDDRDDFAKLLDRYAEVHNRIPESESYIISKDWFDEDDEKLVEPESWCYNYYFLIIYVDRNSRTLTFTEWTYD